MCYKTFESSEFLLFLKINKFWGYWLQKTVKMEIIGFLFVIVLSLFSSPSKKKQGREQKEKRQTKLFIIYNV